MLTLIFGSLHANGSHNSSECAVNGFLVYVKPKVGPIILRGDKIGNAATEIVQLRGNIRVSVVDLHEVRLAFVRLLQFEDRKRQLDLMKFSQRIKR